jgi:hypothetical protein
MKKVASSFLIVALILVTGFVLFSYWPYIFSKNVEGEVIKVEKLMDPVALISRDGDPSNKVFSFAVAIKNETTGEIFTASTEDRQWAAVQGENLCAHAKFFPYPPWQLDKAGTYFGARLIKLWPCSGKKPE